MPTEFRRINFNLYEMIDAVAAYDRYADQKLTCGTIVGARVNPKVEAYVSLEVRLYGTSKSIIMDLSADYVGAALVFFCIRSKIPVPRLAERFLASDHESVSICFCMGEKVREEMISLPTFFDYNFRSVELQFS
jgi:hypothetical protein